MGNWEDRLQAGYAGTQSKGFNIAPPLVAWPWREHRVEGDPLGTPGNPARLFPPETCMVCYHPEHFNALCTDTDHSPGPNDTDIEQPCQCVDYVSEDMRGRIKIKGDFANPLEVDVPADAAKKLQQSTLISPYNMNYRSAIEEVDVPADAAKKLMDWEAELQRRADAISDRESAWADKVFEEIVEEEFDEDTRVPETSILQEAYDHTHGDRQAAYGHPSSDFKATGRIWGAILERWLDSEGYRVGKSDGPYEVIDIPPRIVAIMLTAVKLSREAAEPKHDNRVDAIGYWECANRIVEGEDASP